MPQRVTSVATPVAHLVGPGSLKVVNGHLAFSTKHQGPLRLDPNSLRYLFCYGDVGVTDRALTLLFRTDVHAAWLTPGGLACRGFLARARPRSTHLRLLQLRATSHDDHARLWASQLVAEKLRSHLRAARHYQRHGQLPRSHSIAPFHDLIERCSAAPTLDHLRGLEGLGASLWFSLLAQLLAPNWSFSQRTRRPPRDPVNALLSLGYSCLLARVRARCDAAGLEVYLGVLHPFHPGRPSLACDLIEPLRTPVVDRWVLRLLHRQFLTQDDFLDNQPGFRLHPQAFTRTVAAWEEHLAQIEFDRLLQLHLDRFINWLRSGEPVSPSEEADPSADVED